MDNEARLNESRLPKQFTVRAGRDTLVLGDGTARPVDPERLRTVLQHARGLERVRVLNIEFDSSLRDLRILADLPALKHLRVQGRKIGSLEGLSGRSLETVAIEVDNRTRGLEALAGARIGSLTLKIAHDTDVQCVARVKALTSLRLTACRGTLDLAVLKALPLDDLQVIGRALTDLEGMESLRSLTRLFIQGCPKLERVAGQNTKVRLCVLESCRRLDIGSLRALKSLETLMVTNLGQVLQVADLIGCAKLRELTIQGNTKACFPEGRAKSFVALRELFLVRQHAGIDRFLEEHPRVEVES